MPIHINVAGVWKEVDKVHINVGGVWKECDDVPINVGGVWKTGLIASGPTVSGLANGNYNSSGSAPVYVGIRFHTNGAEYEYTAAGGVGSSVNTWLTSGSSSEVWVAYTKNSGTSFVGKTAGTRYQLNAIQNFYFTANAVLDYRSNNSYFTFYDAASGGNTLDTTSAATWTAEYTGGGGPCPLCCFTPDTLVGLPSGLTIPIKDVREGDTIMGVEGEQVVEEVIVRRDVPMALISFDDGTSIKASPDHPFHSEEGPASLAQTEYKNLGVPAKLKVGSRVFNQEGNWVRITRIRYVEIEPIVYTFSNSLFYADGKLVY